MCIFLPKVDEVSSTQIFARGLAGDRQALIYSMRFAADADVVMVLPLPVPPATGEDAVHFVSLENYPRLFEDVGRAFPEMLTKSRPVAGGYSQPPLQVHAVGAFDASFVPGAEDLDRLDPRFRLPKELRHALGCADYGFAVFHLRPSTTVQVHPMAFSFPRRDPSRLFFPTVHLHDGEATAYADFDHALYCQMAQSAPPRTQDLREFTAGLPASGHVQLDLTKGLLDESLLFRLKLVGRHLNQDTYAEVGEL